MLYVYDDQLKRYNESPTVLSIEILSQGVFKRPAFTVCTEYFDDIKAKEILKE